LTTQNILYNLFVRYLVVKPVCVNAAKSKCILRESKPGSKILSDNLGDGVIIDYDTYFHQNCLAKEKQHIIFTFMFMLVVSAILTRNERHLACLHDRNKSGFFGGPAFI